MAARASSRGARRGNPIGRRVTPGTRPRFVAAAKQLDSGTPRVPLGGEVDLVTAPALERTLLGVPDYPTATARSHENPESEQLIKEHERFAAVETVSGKAAKLARASYPRQWRGQRNSIGDK